MGISERWWVPGLHWGCQELLLGRKGRGSEERLGGPHTAPPIAMVWMLREGAHPHPHLWDATGDRRPPKGSGFPRPSSFHQDDFPPEREAPRCLRHCFLFIPAVEINPVSSEPGERHELISYIWW